MKFSWWGRKKEPPPTSHDEPVKQSGYGVSARNGCNPGTTTGWRSRDRELQDWLPKEHDYEREMRSEAPEVAWEDRLQETIRFVFSHEQEGLLAIGTFALDDLAGARFGLDMIVEPSRTVSDPSSCTSATSSMQLELQNSDVDSDDAALTEFCQKQQKRKELPVFGDHDALIDLQHPVVESNIQVLPIQVLKLTSGGDTSEVVVTNQKLQQKEKREEKLSGVGSAITEHDDDGDVESYYSPAALCGLFPSRSRRSQPKPIEKEKRKKVPLESEANDVKKSSVRSKGYRTSLARLWRSGCHGPPAATAEVSPEPQLLRSESSQSQGSGVPCIANVEPELAKLVITPAQALPKQATAPGDGGGGERKSRRGHSFGKGSWACAHNGKWIRTDSEFVVLEM